MPDLAPQHGRILVVEDEGIVATDIEKCLEDSGFEVTAIAASADDAILEASKTCPDLVLMDIRIQGELDGIQAGEALRRRFGTPIVYLTAHGDKDTLERAKKTEPLAFLMKPFKPVELTNAVAIGLDRARAERELRQKERSFFLALESVADAVLATDEHGHVRFINRAAEALTGWTREEALECHINMVVNALDEPDGRGVSHLGALLDPASDRDPEAELEFRILDRNGTLHWVAAKGAALEGFANRSGRVVVLEEITKRKETLQVLRRQADLLDQSHEPIFTWSPGRAITYWNHGAEALYGFSREEAVGRSAPDLLQTIYPVTMAEITRALERDRKWSGELTHRTKEGRKIVVESLMVTVPEPEGRETVLETHRDITGRKQAEEQLKLLQSAVLQTGDGILIAKISGEQKCHPDPVFMNPALERMTGFSLQDLQGGGLPILYGGPERDPHSVERPRVGCPSKCPVRLEQMAHRKDGSQFLAEFNFMPLADKHGNYTHCVWTCRDITERRRAEETSRLLSSIVESSNDAIISRDLEGNIQTWNKGAERIYGYTEAEAVGRRISFLIPPGHRDEYSQFLEDLRDGKVIEHFETERVRKDGTRIFVSLTISPLQKEGRIAGISIIARDITGQNQAAKALALSEERYRSLTFVSSQIVWTTDARGEVKEDQPLWRAFTGQSWGEVSGWGWLAALHPEDRERTANVWSRAVRTCSVYNVEYRVRRHDGEYREMAVHGVPVLEANGLIREWVGMCVDITERKKAEEEIHRLNQELEGRVIERTAQWQASNNELEAFAYSVSHDLRAPLRAIDGFSRILLEEHAPELRGEAQRYLNLVHKNAVQMGDLIDHLLSFSRLGRQPLKKECIDMTALARQALEELAREQESHRIEIGLGDLPPCEADPALLKQVLVNLLSNALKFTRQRDPARIEIGAMPQDGKPDQGAVYFVRDNGVGFDMQYADKLFGVFQRLHRAEEYDGTGVGLALVHRVITRHGGRVWAQAAVDQGATFYFTLSAAAGSSSPGANASDDAPPPEPPRARLMNA